MIEPFQDMELPERLLRWLELFRQSHNSQPENIEGDGTPEAAVFAAEKTRYYNRTGTAGTLLYVKTTGSDLDTGWVAYG
jgi:hypothetical protein